MTPTQRAAAKRLAKELASVHPLHPYAQMCGSAAALLRELLAEPQKAIEQFNGTEGVDSMSPLERLRFFCSLAMNGQDWLDSEPFFDALAAPQGEPVAWLYESKSGSSFLHRGFTKVRFEADMRASKEYPDGHTMTPLYTHPPPQHKQISDEVVAKLINAEWATSDVPSAWKFARAIERAITGEPT